MLGCSIIKCNDSVWHISEFTGFSMILVVLVKYDVVEGDVVVDVVTVIVVVLV